MADPAGKLPWISPALPGRTHDLTASPHPPHHPDLRTHPSTGILREVVIEALPPHRAARHPIKDEIASAPHGD